MTHVYDWGQSHDLCTWYQASKPALNPLVADINLWTEMCNRHMSVWLYPSVYNTWHVYERGQLVVFINGISLGHCLYSINQQTGTQVTLIIRSPFSNHIQEDWCLLCFFWDNKYSTWRFQTMLPFQVETLGRYYIYKPAGKLHIFHGYTCC